MTDLKMKFAAPDAKGLAEDLILVLSELNDKDAPRRVVSWINEWICIGLVLSAKVKKEETGFRLTIDEGDGRLTYAYADGANGLVAVQLRENGNLIDCFSMGGQQGRDATAFFFYESASGRMDTKSVPMTLDLEKMARKCRKFHRDQKKVSPEQLSSTGQLQRLLREGFEGTQWCGHYPRAENATDFGVSVFEDKCCQAFHRCNHTIDPLTIHHFLWNYNPFPVADCECMQEFVQCLTDVKSDLASTIKKTYQSRPVPCFYTSVSDNHRCMKWDPWFINCEEYAMDLLGHFANLQDYLPLKPKLLAQREEYQKKHDAKVKAAEESSESDQKDKQETKKDKKATKAATKSKKTKTQKETPAEENDKSEL